MIEIRYHGRGGQGARIASRIVGRAGFLAGLYAQDLSLFGAERRGAPVVAFTRISGEPIDTRGYIDEPDLVVVMDDSLLKEAQVQIFHGLRAGTPVLINTRATEVVAPASNLPQIVFIPLDLDAIARQLLSRVALSAVAAGCAARFVPEITTDLLAEAIRIELGEAGLSSGLIEKNVAAAQEAYAQMPLLTLPYRPSAKPSVETPKPFPLLFFSPANGAAAILRPGNAALRQTGRWRSERPEIDLDRCKRCFLCFLFCPEAAISLDRENYPRIDYKHCKGCMICYAECPPRAINRVLEEEVRGA